MLNFTHKEVSKKRSTQLTHLKRLLTMLNIKLSKSEMLIKHIGMVNACKWLDFSLPCKSESQRNKSRYMIESSNSMKLRPFKCCSTFNASYRCFVCRIESDYDDWILQNDTNEASHWLINLIFAMKICLGQNKQTKILYHRHIHDLGSFSLLTAFLSIGFNQCACTVSNKIVLVFIRLNSATNSATQFCKSIKMKLSLKWSELHATKVGS